MIGLSLMLFFIIGKLSNGSKPIIELFRNNNCIVVCMVLIVLFISGWIFRNKFE